MRYFSEETVRKIMREVNVRYVSSSQYDTSLCSEERTYLDLNKFPSVEIDSGWHTGTPTETGLYVVLTEVVTIGIHSSKGTYILDWWDGYCFKNLKGIVQNSPIHRIKEYSWVKWQKIEE